MKTNDDMLISSNFDPNNKRVRLFLLIFTIAFLAKGAVIFKGFAIDDYAFSVNPEVNDFLSHGRPLQAIIFSFFRFLDVNLSDAHLSLGALALFLQCVFILSIFRLSGFEDKKGAGLVGGLIVAHPYLAEILTFRMALPTYCVGMFFSILALESLCRIKQNRTTTISALLAIFAMLITYQTFLNYIAITIIFLFLHSLVSRQQGSIEFSRLYLHRALRLSFVCSGALLVFLVTMQIIKATGVTLIGRTAIIGWSDLSERIQQIFSTLSNIYWHGDPILPYWFKIVIIVLLCLSLLAIVSERSTKKYQNFAYFLALAAGIVIISFASLGVIIAFKDWWPVPRVIAHISLIIGLWLLLADSCTLGNRAIVRVPSYTLRAFILLGFVLLSNQIFSDQQKINKWDEMMSNRIISRLEENNNFSQVRYVHVDGSHWGYPSKLSTVHGDMNISAFSTSWSKLPLLLGVTGYNFKEASGKDKAVGEAYCAESHPWPHSDSVMISGELAIICLDR